MFLELIKKSYRIYHPYFGLKGKGLYHTLLSVLIIIGNISLAFFMSLINAAFDSLMASIVPGVSYRVFFASTGYFLLACLAYSGVVSANNWLAGRLGASIAHQYNKNIVARWLNSGAYFGTKFMGSGYSRVLMCSETPKERDKKTIYLIKKNQTTNIEYWAEDGSIKQFVLDDTWPDEIKKAKQGAIMEGDLLVKKVTLLCGCAQKNKQMSPAQIISHDSIEVTANISYLTDNFLMTTSNFIIGLMGLIVLSGPLVFPLMGFTVYIPDYLAVSTVVYAIGFNLISGWVGNKLRHQQASEKNGKDELYHQLHHVKTHAEPIAFSKGATTYELPKLAATMKKHRLADIALSSLKSMLAFVTSLHEQMAGIFGVIISAPNVIEGHMNTTGVFQVAHHFSEVVRWFTWRNENLDTISNTLVGLERLEAFENILQEWDKLKKDQTSSNSNSKVTEPSQNTPQPVVFSNVTIKNPKNETLIGPLDLNFSPGSITLIKGPSGIGKTSIFRAIAELWPFVTGEIKLPKNEKGETATILFIPQKPYFPYKASLLQAIAYPKDIKDKPISQTKITKIKGWMSELGFNQNHINSLEVENEEWETILSGGEQQRIAIISALYKKPDFLFMDEGTSAIDKQNKAIAEKLLKAHLSTTTIAYIDHNPSSKKLHEQVLKLEEGTVATIKPITPK